MATRRAIVIGSGPSGSVAAMVLAEKGHDVTILEKGDNLFGDLTDKAPSSTFSNDEIKGLRHFGLPDPDREPRVFRRTAADVEPLAVGEVQNLPQTVGGGTVHWDAKTPRFWDIDFRKASLLGPVEGTDVSDWPFDYTEISPFYDEIEQLIGVAGDISGLPRSPTLTHAPRTKKLPMPPGVGQRTSLLAAKGATALGLHPFLTPMAINSEEFDGRPKCNNCGFCSGYGCPLQARIGGLAPLRRALLAGAELRTRAQAVRVNLSGRQARSVTWLDDDGGEHTEAADLVVLACMPLETARLALLSELPDPHDLIGRDLMFHWFTDGTGIFLEERLHADRGRSTTHDIDDFADPDFPGARDAAKVAGLPYFRGGTVELGGSQSPIAEASTYRYLLSVVAPEKPFGHDFKELMRASLLRDRMCGAQLIGEDLPYAANRVDLDPTRRDWRGLPIIRVTYAPGPHELAAQEFYLPWMAELLRKAGANAVTAVPAVSSTKFPAASGDVPASEHIMGGMRMGTDPRASVTDEEGRFHGISNLVVADASVFPTSGGHNPTLTIMATALRNARRWAT
jgi:gluconate 2-dehydrogenase alpha chain